MILPFNPRRRPARAMFLAAAASLLLAVHPSTAAEPTSAELLDALQAALTQEAAANAAAETSGRSGGGSGLSSALQGFRQAREALARGDDRQAAQSIEGYIVSNSRSATVQKAGSDLLARLQVERVAREAAAIAEIDGAIARAGEDAAKAKTARDMDPILASLGKLRDRLNQYDGSNSGEGRQRAANRLQTALSPMRGWQDYLAALESNRPGAARSALQNLSNNDGGASFLPRSELILRMQALADPSNREEAAPARPATPLPDLLARLRTLDDIPPVLRELALHEQTYRRENSQTTSFLSGELDRLARAHALFKAGMPFSLDLIERSTGSPAAYLTTIAPLRAAFVRLALPRALGLPENTPIPAEESVAAFLRRTQEEAKTAGNWPLVARVLEANRRLTEATGPANVTRVPNESSGLEAFFAGRNQEGAGQWSLAVGSYQTALKGGSPDLPTRDIGERLERIRRAHPEEFRLGMERFLEPPERRDGFPPYGRPGYPGYSPGFPGRSSRGFAEPTPPPALSVPAPASTPPAPSAPPAPAVPKPAVPGGAPSP